MPDKNHNEGERSEKGKLTLPEILERAFAHWQSGRGNEKRKGAPRVPRRRWLLWLIILSLVPLLVFFKGQMETKVRSLNYKEFLQLVESNEIVEGAIHYKSPQSPLREITGTYKESSGPNKGQLVPFKLETRLTEKIEDELLRSGKFKVTEPNAMLVSLVWTLLPIVAIAAVIYIFFIRQLKLAGKQARSLLESKPLEAVTQAAMHLPRPQRLALVRFLLELDSASADADAESAWDQEIAARVRAIDEGKVEGIPYEEVLKEGLKRLDERLCR